MTAMPRAPPSSRARSFIAEPTPCWAAGSAPATAAVTGALPAAQQGVGSAMNDLARELGGALGIAVMGSVLQATYRGHLPLPGLPAQLREQARTSLALADRIGGP